MDFPPAPSARPAIAGAAKRTDQSTQDAVSVVPAG